MGTLQKKEQRHYGFDEWDQMRQGENSKMSPTEGSTFLQKRLIPTKDTGLLTLQPEAIPSDLKSDHVPPHSEPQNSEGLPSSREAPARLTQPCAALPEAPALPPPSSHLSDSPSITRLFSCFSHKPGMLLPQSLRIGCSLCPKCSSATSLLGSLRRLLRSWLRSRLLSEVPETLRFNTATSSSVSPWGSQAFLPCSTFFFFFPHGTYELLK